MFDSKKFAASVRAERARVGLTQQQFADRLNVTVATISNWESGNSIPSMSTFFNMCEVLDCEPDTLYAWKQEVS